LDAPMTIFKDSVLLQKGVPDWYLEAVLAPRWITGGDYKEVRR